MWKHNNRIFSGIAKETPATGKQAIQGETAKIEISQNNGTKIFTLDLNLNAIATAQQQLRRRSAPLELRTVVHLWSSGGTISRDQRREGASIDVAARGPD